MATQFPPAFVRKTVNGQKVVSDEVLKSGLSTEDHIVPIHSVRVLTLADGSVVYGCRNHPFEGTLGEVRKHSHAEDGIRRGGHRSPAASHDDAVAAGTVATRKLPYPSAEALSRTLWEVLEDAEKFDDWEDAFAGQQQTIDDLRQQLAAANLRAAEAEKAVTAMKRKVARAFKTLGLNVEG